MNQLQETKDYIKELIDDETNDVKKDVLNYCLDFLNGDNFESFEKNDLLNDIVNYLQNDLCKTLDGSWLVYHNDIQDYFFKHSKDIMEILENCEYFDFNNKNESLNMLEYMTYSSFEIACWDISSIFENQLY
jgi:hypothetical protein